MLVSGSRPNRKFTATILGALWPTTTETQCSVAAEELQGFSRLSSVKANDISRSANSVLAQNSGDMIDAMHVTYAKDSQAVKTQSDLYGVMAEAVRECGRQIEDAKSRLDAIDQRAHDEIEQILKRDPGWFGTFGIVAAIWAVVTRARNEAIAVVTDTVRSIAQQAAKIFSADAPAGSGSAGSSTPSLDDLKREFGMLPSGSRNSFGLSGGFGGKPLAPPPRDIKTDLVDDVGAPPAPPQADDVVSTEKAGIEKTATESVGQRPGPAGE